MHGQQHIKETQVISDTDTLNSGVMVLTPTEPNDVSYVTLLMQGAVKAHSFQLTDFWSALVSCQLNAASTPGIGSYMSRGKNPQKCIRKFYQARKRNRLLHHASKIR